MEIRKKLFKQDKELRKKGKFAKVIHNRLISFDDDILQNSMRAMKNRKLLKSF